MRSGKVLDILDISKPTLLKRISDFSIEPEKLATGENIFRWEHITKLRYLKDFKGKVKTPISFLVSQNKGGVGKSTSAMIFAYLFSYIGKTIIIDFEAQSSITMNFDVNSKTFVHDVIDDISLLDSSIQNLDTNLDLLPNNLRFENWKFNFIQKEKHENMVFKLKNIVKKLKQSYDFIIIDTSPTLDITFEMGMYSADYCLIPAEPKKLSVDPVSSLLEAVAMVNSKDNKGMLNIKLLDLFITKYERNELCDDMSEYLRSNYGTCKTVIRKSTTIEQSQALNKSIFDYDESSKACLDYYNLFFEILEKV